MKTRFAVANLIAAKAGGGLKSAGRATTSDSFLDISGGRIISGEIGFQRFRCFADGATFVGHSEDSKIE